MDWAWVVLLAGQPILFIIDSQAILGNMRTERV